MAKQTGEFAVQRACDQHGQVLQWLAQFGLVGQAVFVPPMPLRHPLYRGSAKLPYTHLSIGVEAIVGGKQVVKQINERQLSPDASVNVRPALHFMLTEQQADQGVICRLRFAGRTATVRTIAAREQLPLRDPLYDVAFGRLQLPGAPTSGRASNQQFAPPQRAGSNEDHGVFAVMTASAIRAAAALYEPASYDVVASMTTVSNPLQPHL